MRIRYTGAVQVSAAGFPWDEGTERDIEDGLAARLVAGQNFEVADDSATRPALPPEGDEDDDDKDEPAPALAGAVDQAEDGEA